jgi:hypothetical protein
MNANVKTQLFYFLVNKGVDPDSADEAATKCATAIYKDGAIGAVGLTAALSYITKQPLVAVGSVPFGAFAGSVVALGASSGCGDVRAAVKRYLGR